MTIIDTSVWIEFLRNKNETLSQRVIELLEHSLAVGLSPVFGELLQGARNDEEEKIILEIWANIQKINETNLAIEAGRLSFRSKLIAKGIGLIDAYILVAAKANQANLWTFDKRLAEAHQKQ